jgi:hypothetical protein
MADTTYQPKVYLKQGGEEIVVASGGKLNIETGGQIVVDGTQGAALTAQLTTITIADAAGTPDYALSALTTTSPYGLATLAEAVTLLYVIKNLQTRMAEMEARLEAAGIVAAN